MNITFIIKTGYTLFVRLLLCLFLCGCTTAWIDAIVAAKKRADAQKPDEKHDDRAYGPPASRKRLVRVWADSDYRAVTMDWRTSFQLQVDRANLKLRRYDVELVVSDMRNWDRRSGTGLAADLVTLVAADPGAGVDLVIGLVSAAPVVTSTLHHLGYARVLGKHCVLRGMDNAAEREVLGDNYIERLRHKQSAVLIHEWGHTVGAVHGSEVDDYMHPSYSHHQTGFSYDNEELIEAALATSDRRAALMQTLEKRKQRRALTVDESELALILSDKPPAAAIDETELTALRVVDQNTADKCKIRSMRRAKLLSDTELLSELQPTATKINADSALIERKDDHAMVTLLRCR